MIEKLAALSTVAFVIASAVVGARLILLWRRTGGLPELTLGFGLLVIAGIGYPITLAARIVIADSPELGRWLTAIGAVPMGVGWGVLWIFTLKVFRRESIACRWLVRGALTLIGLVIVTCVHHALTIPDPRDISYSDPRLLANAFIAILSYLWAAIESFRYWGLMRRRVALGLADPVVANRFLLFGWVMVFSTISTGVAAISSSMGINTLESPPVMAAAAIAGLLCSLTLWLAFLPPPAYLRRLRTA